MKYKISIITYVLIAILFSRCKDSLDISLLTKEYKIIKADLRKNVEINSIKIIEVTYPTFEQLANHEIKRMQNLNINLSKLIENRFIIDSLLKSNIDIRNQESGYAFDEKRIDNAYKNVEDSIKIRNEMKSRINNELELAENQLRMLEIESMVKSDSTLKEKSKRIKHQIKYSVDGRNFCDTLIFASFGKEEYQYITKNIFRNHE